MISEGKNIEKLLRLVFLLMEDVHCWNKRFHSRKMIAS